MPEPVIDDAVLILSELLSNSFRHARPLETREAGGGGDAGDANGTRSARDTPRTGNDDWTAGGRHDSPRTDDPQTDRGRTANDRTDGGRSDSGRTDCGECGIRAAWAIGTDGLLAVEVTDGGGPTRPRPSTPSLSAHGGRGLGIVGSLSLRWGVRDDAPGEVTVWAVLAVRARHARRDDPVIAGGTVGTGPTDGTRGQRAGLGGIGGTGISPIVGAGGGLPVGMSMGMSMDLAESIEAFDALGSLGSLNTAFDSVEAVDERG
ncbi:ATP-binding protein [Streptomyces sp. CBMA29]|uniref:ATP-binding protein n=1 Tax=Streptomyces sp. CBMA29 TaxID=1896314 RepID=UPI002948BE52|nr:ATP-binding protein [Streptomyces sp. CBMA29]